MIPLRAIERASRTRRWHANADLCDTHDPVSAHQGRAALWALLLFPDRPAVREYLLTHDLGEYATGDVPADAKRANPALREMLRAIEADAIAALGIAPPDLDGLDATRAEFCDRLDAYLHAWRHAPEILSDPDWREDARWLWGASWSLGIHQILCAEFDAMGVKG